MTAQGQVSVPRKVRQRLDIDPGWILVSIRLEADDYQFFSSLAETAKEDLSTAVRDLIARGRILLALNRYRDGKASLSKAAEVAGVSVSEMMDLLAGHGIASDLQAEDYRESLRTLREVW